MSNTAKFATAALLAAVMAAQAPAAKAEDGRHGAAALGVLGGIAVGAAIAGQPRERDRPRRRVNQDNSDQAQVCHLERRRVENQFGEISIRRVRVCE